MNPPLRKPIPQTHSDEPINQSQPTTMPRSNHEPNLALVQVLNEKERCEMRERRTLHGVGDGEIEWEGEGERIERERTDGIKN